MGKGDKMEDQEKDLILQSAEEEALKVQGGLSVYEQLNPRPVFEPLSKADIRRMFGIIGSLDLLAAIGAVLLSAVRLGTVVLVGEALFLDSYRAILDANPLLRFITAGVPTVVIFSSMLTFELFVFNHGYREGIRGGPSKFGEAALWGSVATMILAGFVSSMFLVPGISGTDLEFRVSLGIAVLISVVATFNAHEGARNAGARAFNVEQENRRRHDEYRGQLAAWQAEFQKWAIANLGEIFQDDRHRYTGREKKRIKANGHNPQENEEQRAQAQSFQKFVEEFLAQNGWRASEIGTHEGAVRTAAELVEQMELFLERQLTREEKKHVSVSLVRAKRKET